jgi:hypothetical protein
MFWKWFSRRVANTATLFNGHFIEVKTFYTIEFNIVPCVTFIGELDITKAYAYINEQLSANTVAVYQHAYFDHGEKEVLFNNTILVLKDNRMIELGPNYCQILHTTIQYAWARHLVKELAAFRVVQQEPAIGFARQTTMN